MMQQSVSRGTIALCLCVFPMEHSTLQNGMEPNGSVKLACASYAQRQ